MDKNNRRLNRREFLKLAGLGAGGVIMERARAAALKTVMK